MSSGKATARKVELSQLTVLDPFTAPFTPNEPWPILATFLPDPTRYQVVPLPSFTYDSYVITLIVTVYKYIQSTRSDLPVMSYDLTSSAVDSLQAGLKEAHGALFDLQCNTRGELRKRWTTFARAERLWLLHSATRTHTDPEFLKAIFTSVRIPGAGKQKGIHFPAGTLEVLNSTPDSTKRIDALIRPHLPSVHNLMPIKHAAIPAGTMYPSAGSLSFHEHVGPIAYSSYQVARRDSTLLRHELENGLAELADYCNMCGQDFRTLERLDELLHPTLNNGLTAQVISALLTPQNRRLKKLISLTVDLLKRMHWIRNNISSAVSELRDSLRDITQGSAHTENTPPTE